MLAPYLEGDKPTHINTNRETGEKTREWNLKCPLHDDSTRSASLNLDKALFWCAKCGGMPVTALIRRHAEWHPPGVGGRNGNKPDANGQPDARPQTILTEGMIAGWHSALISTPGALQWLEERRGLTMETIVTYQIGLKNSKLYTIPVRSETGDIWNVRYYNPNPAADRRKIWGEEGYNSPPRLYPINVLNAGVEEVFVAEGEWDTLLLLQHGIPAVTRTAGATHWNNAWGEWFKGMRVYVGQDRDTDGDKANRLIARSLQTVADVRIVELPYPLVKKHGKDVTDFLLEHGPDALRELMNAAPAFGKRGVREASKDEIKTVTVLDTFDAQRVGEAVKVVVTIKGRKEPGYTVPKKIRLACDQKAGQKCTVCPLNASSGEAVVEVTADDPLVLAMVEATTNAVHQEIAQAYGIPGGRCQRLQQEVEEHQAVEILFGRPALDYSDGTKAGEYKNITVTSVGRHDTLANNTVAAIGALHPSPRTQRNEFLSHELEILETSVDRFEINKETIALMKRFQPTARQTPLKKLAEISRALSDHVTLIQGRPEMHALMDLTFHSVLSFKFAGEQMVRGWVESIILGDTGTGKSSAATRLIRHYGAGEIISCEAATFAGIVGGVQQMNGKDWAVTWGAVPINDKRLVVLDEVSGLTVEEIAQMSDIRSSGQAKLIKVVQETTWARCRLLWMGNPRNATMENFTYGVNALRPLIGNAEDVARFDLAMAVTKYDVADEIINQRREPGELKYTSEACHALLLWAWTRQSHQIKWGRGAEKAVFDAANELGKLYTSEPPLILAASVRVKIARISAAIAARLFSTDASYENIVVEKQHVEAAVQFINLLYGMPAFGYREQSRERLADRYAAEQATDMTKQYLLSRPLLAKHLRNAGKFRRQDLEEIMNISREEANGIINTLYEARMVRRVLGDIYVEPTLHTLLRELKI